MSTKDRSFKKVEERLPFDKTTGQYVEADKHRTKEFSFKDEGRFSKDQIQELLGQSLNEYLNDYLHPVYDEEKDVFKILMDVEDAEPVATAYAITGRKDLAMEAVRDLSDRKLFKKELVDALLKWVNGVREKSHKSENDATVLDMRRIKRANDATMTSRLWKALETFLLRWNGDSSNKNTALVKSGKSRFTEVRGENVYYKGSLMSLSDFYRLKAGAERLHSLVVEIDTSKTSSESNEIRKFLERALNAIASAQHRAVPEEKRKPFSPVTVRNPTITSFIKRLVLWFDEVKPLVEAQQYMIGRGRRVIAPRGESPIESHIIAENWEKVGGTGEAQSAEELATSAAAVDEALVSEFGDQPYFEGAEEPDEDIRGESEGYMTGEPPSYSEEDMPEDEGEESPPYEDPDVSSDEDDDVPF
jgi:hypothetical protein